MLVWKPPAFLIVGANMLALLVGGGLFGIHVLEALPAEDYGLRRSPFARARAMGGTRARGARGRAHSG